MILRVRLREALPYFFFNAQCQAMAHATIKFEKLPIPPETDCLILSAWFGRGWFAEFVWLVFFFWLAVSLIAIFAYNIAPLNVKDCTG